MGNLEIKIMIKEYSTVSSLKKTEPLPSERHSLRVTVGGVLEAEASHTHSASLDSGQVEKVKVGGQVSDRETIHCALKALD